MIDSYTIFHQFTTTGVHSLQLSVDTGGVVDEMNDATSGTDNNIWMEDIEVMALGVRVVVDNEDGSIPESPEDRASNAQMVLDDATNPVSMSRSPSCTRELETNP